MRWMRWMWLLAAAALAACGSKTGTVSVSVKSAAATADAATGGASLGNGIVLTEVRMVVRRIELVSSTPAPEPAPSRADMDKARPEEPDDDLVQKFGPFAVDVAGDKLTGGIHPAFDAVVDPGTYAGARLVVNTLPKGFSGTDPVLTAMQGLHASIAIDGTIDGKTFQFVTPMRVAQSKAGPIVVGTADKKTTNLTLDVNPKGWFTGEDGKTRLDPTLDSDRGQILENIRCSIRIFEDDDEDGEPDDGDRGHVEGCPSTPAPSPTPTPTPPPIMP